MNNSKPIDIRNREPYSLEQFVVPDWARNDLQEILLSEGEIKSRIDRLSQEVSDFYKDKNLLVLSMLKGAVRFFNDLFFSAEISYSCNFIPASSYPEGTESSGEPEIYLDNKIINEVQNRHILMVEDIFDTGKTLDATYKLLQKYSPSSIEIIVLTDKPERRYPNINVKPRWTGFIISNKFVVGYGLDFNEKYRGLRHLCVLKPEIYEANQ